MHTGIRFEAWAPAVNDLRCAKTTCPTKRVLAMVTRSYQKQKRLEFQERYVGLS